MMDEDLSVVDVTVSARDMEAAIKALQKGRKDPKYLEAFRQELESSPRSPRARGLMGLFIYAANHPGRRGGVEELLRESGMVHNALVGCLFEEKVRKLLLKKGVVLRRGFSVLVGVAATKKRRKFDLGSDNPPILVECKSHTWTQGGNMPSAKMTVWNEAMYYFHVAPAEFRKILFVFKHERAGQSLAAYYLRTHGHLVPNGVEVWELDTHADVATQLR
jgi:hypothetical protein